MDIIAPTINAGSTLKAELVRQLTECLYALQETEDRLQRAAPDAVDYGSAEIIVANEQHDRRVHAIELVAVEIAAILAAVQSQEDDRDQEIEDAGIPIPGLDLTVEQALAVEAEKDVEK